MNKRPVSYKQYDSRWANFPYNDTVHGESGKTISSSGCGPTVAAMLVATILGEKYTPIDAAKWSMTHGYKWKDSGTALAYFTDQFKAMGIDCFMLSWTDTYHKPDHKNHDIALDYLNRGYYLIANAHQGLWTSAGHFVVIYDFDDKYVYVNDPNSDNPNREKASIETMRNDIAYYWVVDARRINRPDTIEKEEEELTKEEFKRMFREAMIEYRNELQDNDTEYGDKSKPAREFCIKNKIFNGDRIEDPNFMWEDFLTREQAAILFYNAARRLGVV